MSIHPCLACLMVLLKYVPKKVGIEQIEKLQKVNFWCQKLIFKFWFKKVVKNTWLKEQFLLVEKVFLLIKIQSRKT